MNAEALIEKYGLWGEHPDYPVKDWATLASQNEVRSGYWTWVESSIARDSEHGGEARRGYLMGWPT